MSKSLNYQILLKKQYNKGTISLSYYHNQLRWIRKFNENKKPDN